MKQQGLQCTLYLRMYLHIYIHVHMYSVHVHLYICMYNIQYLQTGLYYTIDIRDYVNGIGNCSREQYITYAHSVL